MSVHNDSRLVWIELIKNQLHLEDTNPIRGEIKICLNKDIVFKETLLTNVLLVAVSWRRNPSYSETEAKGKTPECGR